VEVSTPTKLAVNGIEDIKGFYYQSNKITVKASARFPEKEDIVACCVEVKGTYTKVEIYPVVPRPMIVDVRFGGVTNVFIVFVSPSEVLSSCELLT